MGEKFTKRLLSIVLFCSLAIAANAVPAKRGLWRKITLNDGTTVYAELRGDGQRKSGKYTSVDNDAHPGYMAYEAIVAAEAAGADFSQYDWDNDGDVEEVFLIYAGQGEADGGDESTIWPHKFSISSSYSNEEYYSSSTSLFYKDSSGQYQQWSEAKFPNNFTHLTYDGKTIDVYACANELASNETSSGSLNGTQINGIGTICHEFSHCMGFPDMYDVNYGGNYGMNSWDLMDQGSYNGEWNGGNTSWSTVSAGYRPAGYSAYERWVCGWDTPIELTDPQKITNLKPAGGTSTGASDFGKAYVVYMPASTKAITGEYYLLENREWLNWDQGLPWFGLMIYYVDYDETAWTNNKVNTTSHQRMSMFQAGGTDPGYLKLDTYPYNIDYLPQILSSSWGSTGAKMAANLNSQYGSNGLTLNTASNNVLDNNSTPQAYYWGSSSSSQKLTDHEIWNIETNWVIENSKGTGATDRTVNFIYRKPSANTLTLNQTTTTEEAIAKGLYTSVTVNKTLTAGIYNTLWLPFDLNMLDVRNYFGTDAKVFKFSGVDNGTDGHVTLNFTDDTNNGITAYTPVLVKLGDGEATKDNITFTYQQVNTANADTIPQVEVNGWKFVGTKTYETVPTGDLFLSENKYYISEGTSKLKAYRAYLVPASGGSAKSFVNNFKEAEPNTFDVDNTTFFANSDVSLLNAPEDIVTKIDGVTVNMKVQTTCGDIYNLNGQKVGSADDKDSLPKGVYVVNGKKVVIK
jgi:M6 family metalloprotease-like protein